jgi:hypothetical protein
LHLIRLTAARFARWKRMMFPLTGGMWLSVAAPLLDWLTAARSRAFATIVRDYMTGDDEGCCCLTGQWRS